MLAKDRSAIRVGCNYYSLTRLGLKYEYIFRPNALLGLSAYNLVHQTEIKSAQSSKGRTAMKFINTLIDFAISLIGIAIIAGFAYFFYTSGLAQNFSFTMPSMDAFSFSFDKPQIQGYAILVVGLAIGAQLFKAAIKTDHTQMA